tara:strand:- start:211 stop:414 length:204 start_codon:yes stop_codon:yes gene_type:complete
MINITFNYGYITPRENLAVAHNTWLTDVEMIAIKHMVENGNDSQCKEFKVNMEKRLTNRINASLAFY